MRKRTYNPAQLTAEELKASFTARGELLTQMLDILRAQKPGRPCQHLLLVGARGMGKTTLGLRFLQAVREAEDLATAWQPVPFDEESYEVTDIAGLWLLALQHLSRATSENRWQDRAEELLRNERDPGRREAYALASLLDYRESSGRRLILFVENLDQLFAQIGDERELHALRSVLIEHPELLLIGSACTSFDDIQDHKAPFYEFFQRIDLRGLGSEACRSVFDGAFKREGKPLPADFLSAEQARIETVRALTGGNPRLLVLAAEILMESPLGSAFEDLERLIDEQTPYFKALIEALPVQARKVFHYLAGEWAPLRARDIADGVDLTPSHISAQLRQLTHKGYVHELRLTGETKMRYEVADRFYNIYYLLRFNRPGRERLKRFVTSFHDLYGDSGMHALYAAVLRSMRERTIPASELADWILVFSEHVAEDQRFVGREEWLEGAVKTSIELLGTDTPVLDELDAKAPFAAMQPYVQKSGEHLRAGRFAEANSLLARVAHGPQPELRGVTEFLAGWARLIANESDEALALFEEAVVALPEDAQTMSVQALALIAGLSQERGENDNAAAAVERAWHSVQPVDRETVFGRIARSLYALGEELWQSNKHERAVGAWLLMSRVVTSEDGSQLRYEVLKALARAGLALNKVGEYERSREVLGRMDGVVDATDDAGLRLFRLVGLLTQGYSCSVAQGSEDALAVWQRAPDFVQPGDGEDVHQLAGVCLAMASKQLGVDGADDDQLRQSKSLARRAVELVPESALALHALAHVFALAGDWEEAITALRRICSSLGDTEGEEATIMLPTLIHIASAGHLAEVHDLMANTQLREDLEALWYALELELGHAIEALPAEIKNATDEIRHRLVNPRDLHSVSATTRQTMVFLVPVGIGGGVLQPYPGVLDESKVALAYDELWQQLNGGNDDPRTRVAIHALGSHQHWPEDREFVSSNVGHAANRSCDPSLCLCESLGLPVKDHPHLVVA